MALWVELPESIQGQAVFEAALAQRIGVLPGHLFSVRGDYHHHVRLSCGLRWTTKCEDALRVLGKLAGRRRS